MIKRNFRAGSTLTTSLRLEKIFWDRIDATAEQTGQRWQDWVNSTLLDKPPSVSRASWLRCAMVD